MWFHGDAQPGNLLLDSTGRLSAVIDFGTCGIGDPAFDTTIAWTFFSGESQRVFKQQLPVDGATWTRGRGWTIWKAMIVLVCALDTDPTMPSSRRASSARSSLITATPGKAVT
jgi:aminoglycoside phosphotransferase (APT) family kinase protein